MAGSLMLLLLGAMLLQAVSAVDAPVELQNETTKIQEILDDEPAYHGKMVVVEGKIELECSSGCWFVVNDGTGSIYVDILPSNFVIPQKSGSDVKVYGEVTTRDGDPQIIGKIVEIDGEIRR